MFKTIKGILYLITISIYNKFIILKIIKFLLDKLLKYIYYFINK